MPRFPMPPKKPKLAAHPAQATWPAGGGADIPATAESTRSLAAHLRATADHLDSLAGSCGIPGLPGVLARAGCVAALYELGQVVQAYATGDALPGAAESEARHGPHGR
jgi:hypothetical protein